MKVECAWHFWGDSLVTTTVVVVVYELKDSLIERRAISLRLDVNIVIIYDSPKSFYLMLS